MLKMCILEIFWVELFYCIRNKLYKFMFLCLISERKIIICFDFCIYMVYLILLVLVSSEIEEYLGCMNLTIIILFITLNIVFIFVFVVYL